MKSIIACQLERQKVIKMIKGRSNQVNDDTLYIKSSSDEKDANIFHQIRKNVKELIAPNGVNPNPLDHFILHDAGIDIYTICMYIHKLPRYAKFASTFAPLFNFPNVTSTVFIIPMTEGKSSKQLDSRVLMLDTELRSAEKEGDRNKVRKIMGKLADAEKWAQDIESGDNTLYDVAFLFVLQAPDYETLRLRVTDFNMRAREKGIELQACYGVHPEAFLSAYPVNKIYTANLNQLVKTTTIKKHVFDKRSLATIFNHTDSYFSHKDGIPVGRDLVNGQLILWDNYDPSHDGYGVIFCGGTGSGKSATVKMLGSRNINFGYVIRSIDFEARGNVGEYAIMAIKEGGVNYQIKNGSNNVLNIFDVDPENEYDELTGQEYSVLRLNDKITDVKYMLLTMIRDGIEINDFSLYTFVSRIISDIVQSLYQERGIYDMNVDSLYTTGETLSEDGKKITSGRVKKLMPTITDFYKKVLICQKNNNISHHEVAYQIIIDAMKDFVKELYYCPVNLRFFTKNEYEDLPKQDNIAYYIEGNKKYPVIAIKGSRSYFDGQSTITASPDTPHINIDISQLPEKERPIALLVALSCINENYVKRNSSNPLLAQNMIVVIDEFHKIFPYEEALLLASNAYRTFRKRHVAPWTISQALADYDVNELTRAIIKNSSSIFLFKQNYQDRAFLKESTPLTESQLERVFTLGGDVDDPEEKAKRRGECCLIENHKTVVFLKVDYLVESEALIVETDIEKIKELYKGSAS